ncbi:MAG: glycine zipper 2TM domain-containing protein [Caldimonas sp.]
MTPSRKLTACLFTLAAAMPLALIAPLAHGQSRGAEAHHSHAARIESFSVVQVSRVGPGSELEFALAGAPNRKISLQIAGATAPLDLAEVQPGRYEGSYTVRARDRITADSLVTARIERDGETTTAFLDQSVVRGARSPLQSLPQISDFQVTAPERVRPGDELVFSMNGSPGGKARVMVPGVPHPIALDETSRGVYQGSYTLRRQDRTDGPLSATGLLVVNGKESMQRFDRDFGAPPQRASERPVELRAAAACANCGVIESVRRVEESADSNNVLGTVAGGVAGGVLGHQVGGGKGRDLATIAGALGGAYAGNRVQNNMNKSAEYLVVVRLESGASQTVKFENEPSLKVGERVKVENNNVVRL